MSLRPEIELQKRRSLVRLFYVQKQLRVTEGSIDTGQVETYRSLVARNLVSGIVVASEENPYTSCRISNPVHRTQTSCIACGGAHAVFGTIESRFCRPLRLADKWSIAESGDQRVTLG